MKKRTGNGLATKLKALAAEFILNVVLVTSRAKQGPLPAYRRLRKEVLRQLDREYASAALREAWGNMSEAARIAKIDRKHLWRIMRRTGVKYTP